MSASSRAMQESVRLEISDRASTALEEMVLKLDRVAKALEPDHSEIIAAEHARLIALVREKTRSWRYRNICFDGRDTILTPVVPLGTVERLLYEMLVDQRRWKRLKTSSVPAIGEQEREDGREEEWV